MNLNHDKEADAIYITLSDKPYAYGKDLDEERRIDYDADNNPIGIELLCVSTGVNIDELPEQSSIGKILGKKGIKVFA